MVSSIDEVLLSHVWIAPLMLAIYTGQISAVFNIRNMPPKITTLRVTPESAEGLPVRTQRFLKSWSACVAQYLKLHGYKSGIQW